MFKGKTLNELRKIRQFEEDFEPKHFVNDAQEIYLNSYQAIVE